MSSTKRVFEIDELMMLQKHQTCLVCSGYVAPGTDNVLYIQKQRSEKVAKYRNIFV
jgi:hypothetical protein